MPTRHFAIGRWTGEENCCVVELPTAQYGAWPVDTLWIWRGFGSQWDHHVTVLRKGSKLIFSLSSPRRPLTRHRLRKAAWLMRPGHYTTTWHSSSISVDSVAAIQYDWVCNPFAPNLYLDCGDLGRTRFLLIVSRYVQGLLVLVYPFTEANVTSRNSPAIQCKHLSWMLMSAMTCYGYSCRNHSCVTNFKQLSEAIYDSGHAQWFRASSVRKKSRMKARFDLG